MSVSVSLISRVTIPPEQVSQWQALPLDIIDTGVVKLACSRSFVPKLRLALPIHNCFINNDEESDPATPGRSPIPWKAIIVSEAGLDLWRRHDDI